MSIIERYSPLNLAYKVFIVTNASSATGVVVCNTLMKANALVLGTDDKIKDDSLTESTYTHFQFHKCKLTDTSSVDDIIADAKRKFKVDRIDGLVNIASTDDDRKTQDAHKRLVTACAKTMDSADGGTIVTTALQATSEDDKVASQATNQLTGAMKDLRLDNSSSKVRSNVIAPGDKENIKACQEYQNAKEHLEFLYKPPGNPNGKASERKVSEETHKMFELSNVVLFLSSGMSEALDGAVLNYKGEIVQN